MPSTPEPPAPAAAASSRCRLCGKSFQNKASTGRHERYCRNRRACPPPPRRKSCLHCIRAKSRCDSCVPTCEPCQRRGKSCIYTSESLSPTAREGQSRLSATRSKPQNQAPRSLVAPRELSQGASLRSGLFITFEACPSSVAPRTSTPLSSEMREFTSTKHGEASDGASGQLGMPFTTGSSELRPSFSSHLLRPKRRKTGQMELISKLISQMLRSFPERRMNEVSCPPFIHRSAFQRSSSENPIIICQSITRQFSAREIHEDASLWDAIASEQERIYDLRGSLDRSLHLASAQAITMYLLMLATEAESVLTHHPHASVTLLFTLGRFSRYSIKYIPVL
ncbi:uncharacterized protein LY89DRAFT_270009 [Mollisia scopiformis]|uniref:Zn(2)-C6 fungal-type domain-containing protein n=1 Tax=Mollisia scopiformis TaxID=149040 RepID=A0A132BCF4_MOLSC|nr:uncharacterized protein LY89DRAFT_270009 [Mollisia scopiformis]KUJ10110.1 hypothetical protein LY89DRAFT_270009 [Mollisia scopiformis]